MLHKPRSWWRAHPQRKIVPFSPNACEGRVAVGLLLMLAWSAADGTTFEARQSAGQRRALLIGVTTFQDARLKPRSLKGPANDVSCSGR